jgi:hypothetical protein
MIRHENKQRLQNECVGPIKGKVQFRKPTQLFGHIRLLVVDNVDNDTIQIFRNVS